MAGEAITAGDTVQLKSGGPVMTVDQVAERAGGGMAAWCQWFEKNKLERGTFLLTSLVKYD